MSPPSSSSGSSAGRITLADHKMTSSANDVWGVIFASTSVFPQVLPNLYKEIKTTKPDGYSPNSMREINYGYAAGFGDTVKSSIEEIKRVEHTTRTVIYEVTSGDILEHHDTFDTTIMVTPMDGVSPRKPGCKVSWTCDYTGATGAFSAAIVKAFWINTLDGLDSYLQKLAKNSQ